MGQITAHIQEEKYMTIVSSPFLHTLIADELEADGGQNLGFMPTELISSALGACTAITLRMYADRKGWKVSEVNVDVSLVRDKEKNTTQIERKIELKGELSEEERQRLLQIANACPVHKILSNPIEIISSLV